VWAPVRHPCRCSATRAAGRAGAAAFGSPCGWQPKRAATGACTEFAMSMLMLSLATRVWVNSI
jgi:hypothetical protein